MLQQAYTPSNTGIASFVHASADYDLAPIGIGSMQEQADRLAEFGRNGDVYVVHAAEGETVIPMEVLDSNPQVKEMLFAQMRDMGMDPERYVVGNELNSINPDTGMPEFWFKSIWKSVKKVFKKVAPIIAPILGNAILPGIGGILASMLVTKLQGGSWGDTLKAGAFSYLGGVVSGGIGGLTSGSGFLAGATEAATAPWNALSNLSGTFNAGILGSGAAGAATTAATSAAARTAGTGGAGAAGTGAAGTGAAGTGAAGTGAAGAGTAGGFQPGAVQPLVGPDSVASLSGAGLPPGAVKPFTGGGSSVDFFPEVIGTPGDFAKSAGSGIPSDIPLSAGEHLIQRFGSGAASAPGTQFAGDPNAFIGGFDPNLPGNAVPSAPVDYWGDASVPGSTNLAPVVQGSGQTTKPAFWERQLSDIAPETGRAADEYSSKAGDYLIRGGDTQQVVDQNMLKEENAYIARRVAQGIRPTEAGIEAARAGAGPSIYAKYGPSLALAGGAAYLGGAFDEPEDPDKEAREEAEIRAREAMSPSRRNALLQANRGQFEIADLDPYKYRPELNPRSYQGTRSVNFARAAADGGFIDGPPQYLNYGGTAQYPRREMLVEGPGTERSDDIPAMLSDGEFVLNSRSVRGADPTGQGNRYRGAQNLYNMMRNFEMRG